MVRTRYGSRLWDFEQQMVCLSVLTGFAAYLMVIGDPRGERLADAYSDEHRHDVLMLHHHGGTMDQESLRLNYSEEDLQCLCYEVLWILRWRKEDDESSESGEETS